MQAIKTHWLAPTSYRNPRIVARCDAGRLTIDQPDNLAIEDGHTLAAEKLRDRLGWTPANGYGPMVRGYLPDGGYAFVFLTRDDLARLRRPIRAERAERLREQIRDALEGDSGDDERDALAAVADALGIEYDA